MDSTSPTVRNLGWLAAACFLSSWFLPAANEVPGWMAFRYGLSALWPYKGATTSGFGDAAPQVMSALTNVVFIVMFALLLANRIARPGLYIRVAIACFILDLYWLVQLLRDGTAGQLRIGYYVWLLAFALLIAVGVLRMRTLSAASDRRT